MVLDYQVINQLENRVKEFCRNHKKIYLYGAGMNGKAFFYYLQEKGVAIDGFITTDGGGSLFGRRIYKASQIMPMLHEGSGIVLAVSEDIQREIRNTVYFNCGSVSFTDIEWAYLSAAVFRKDKYHSRKRWDFQKNIVDHNWGEILAIQLEVTFGDMVWSSAFYRELRRNFPCAHITIVMNERHVSLYEWCPYIDKVLPYDCSTLNDCISEKMAKKAEKYASENFMDMYDVVFLPRLLPMTFSDAWENVLLAEGSGARYRVAHALYMTEFHRVRYGIVEDMFSEIVKHEKAQHEAKNDLGMIDVFSGKVMDERMELWVSQEDVCFAETLLRPYRGNSVVVAVALVGSVGTRSWDPGKYGEVFCTLLQKFGQRLLFVFCGGSDAVGAAGIVGKYTKGRCIDMAGKTNLTEAAAIISKSDIYIGSDTGLMHMASAFGIPVIEISASIEDSPDYWGSTPTRTGPWKVPSIVLRPRKGLDGCKYMCHRKEAHCINQITVEETEKAMEDMLHFIQESRHGNG